MKKYLIFIIKIYVLLTFGIFKVYSKEIPIKFDDNNWKVLNIIINNNQNDNELVLNFLDDHYFFEFENVSNMLNINVNTNIKFIGTKNKTVFDFNYKDHAFYFFYNERNYKGYTVSFENIIFKNYKYSSLDGGMGIVLVEASSENFGLFFENCIFQNNFNSLLRFNVKNKKTDKEGYSFLMNNCKFM